MIRTKDYSKKDLLAKIKALGDITKEQRNEIVCSLIGHSRIVTYCFGYVNCARCDAQTGDTLMGLRSLEENVVVGHDCEVCRANYKKMSWRDRLYTKNPFPKEEEVQS